MAKPHEPVVVEHTRGPAHVRVQVAIDPDALAAATTDEDARRALSHTLRRLCFDASRSAADAARRLLPAPAPRAPSPPPDFAAEDAARERALETQMHVIPGLEDLAAQPDRPVPPAGSAVMM